MLKNYIESFSAEGKEIAVVGITIHNPKETAAVASMWISNKKSILEMAMDPKESVFLNTKIFLSGTDKLMFEGCDFTVSVSEEDAL